MISERKEQAKGLSLIVDDDEDKIYFINRSLWMTDSMAYGTGGSMLHLQGLSNNPYPYPEPNHPDYIR
jgi:hypothetical protein